MTAPGEVRLLPWTTDGGLPCYAPEGSGWLTVYAEAVESQQLVMGHDLLERAAALLTDESASPTLLRFYVARLSEALRDALRVAESRGARIPDRTDSGDPDDGDDGPELPAEAFG